jgi:FixJ family two-component response regulator
MAVTTGAGALAAVPRFVPDVHLVDIDMPGLSGPQVLVLRGAGSKMPVIAVSGHVSGPMEGLFAFFEKPIRYQLLLRVVASAVGRDPDQTPF